MKLILKYFPNLTDTQVKQFEQLPLLYTEWNEKINVISRKDIDNIETHHILHSLAIARFLKFVKGTEVLDAGTGGGFPGIPLAIMFPDVKFYLVDSTGKKLKVIEAVVEALGLTNVLVIHGRVEELHHQFDFIVSRAVARIVKLNEWTKGKFKKESQQPMRNGLILLKGGRIDQELREAGLKGTIIPISKYFTEPFFDEKSVVYIRKVN